MVAISNTTEQPGEFTMQINHDGKPYVTGIIHIAPRETKTYDIRKLRDEQKPDINGYSLPRNLGMAQVRWSVRGKARLSGRAEVVSAKDKVSSSYSCFLCCGYSYAGGFITPFGATVLPGATVGFTAWERATISGGQSCGSDPEPYPVGGWWWSSNGSVTVDSSGTATAVSGGSADIYCSWTAFRNEWDEADQSCEQIEEMAEAETSMTVKPSISRLEPDRGLIGQTHSVTVVGDGFADPASVNVGGSGITATVKSVGPRSIVVDFAMAAEAGEGNHTVSVTVNGETSNSVNFFVQIPKSLRRDQITGLVDIDPGPGNITDIFNRVIAQNACGGYRNLKYTLLDQGNPAQAITFEDGVEILEAFSDYQGPEGLRSKLVPANDFTNNVGELADTVAIFGPSSDCPPPFTLSFKQSFKAKIGNKEWTLTTNNSISIEKKADGTYTITVTPQ